MFSPKRKTPNTAARQATSQPGQSRGIFSVPGSRQNETAEEAKVRELEATLSELEYQLALKNDQLERVQRKLAIAQERKANGEKTRKFQGAGFTRKMSRGMPLFDTSNVK